MAEHTLSQGDSEKSTFKEAIRYQNLRFNGQMEKMQSYFEEICQSFSSRRLSVAHIINKAEASLEQIINDHDVDLQVKFSQIESSINNKLRGQYEEIQQTRSILEEFVLKEWSYFDEICKKETADQKMLIETLIQTSKKRMGELNTLYERQKFEAAEGLSIIKIKTLLRDKCGILEKQLGNIKDNTNKCKKQVQKQLKGMLRILEDIEDGRTDRQSKEECIISLIDKMDNQIDEVTTR